MVPGPPMELADLPEAKVWLCRFHKLDRPPVRDLLRSLSLVSASHFRRGLRELLDQSEPDETIALYAITEATRKPYFADKRRSPRPAVGRRRGSEAIVEALISSWHDEQPGRLLDHPPIATLKRKRVHHIGLVDDIVGSGNRAAGFLRDFMDSPTLRSWRSYGKIKVSVLAYAATPEGEDRVRRQLRTKRKPGPAGNVQVLWKERPGPRAGFAIQAKLEALRDVCRRYGAGRASAGFAEGFGRCMSMLVFEHKCPNNVPSMLWKHSTQMTPLFPDGAVPPWCAPAFDAAANGSIVGRVAADHFLNSTIEVLRRSTSSDGVQLLLVMAALQSLRRPTRVGEALCLDNSELQRILALGEQAGFVVGGRSLTALGKAELEHASTLDCEQKVRVATNAFYYPR